jgi:steroid delta-isomerase-like uncharacterized protein
MTVEETTRSGELAGEAFARDFAQRWQVAWNARVPEGVAELCTEDVVWDDPLTDRPERGRAAVASYLSSVWRTFPDLEFTWPEGPYASFSGIKLALHWSVTGTMLGPAEPQGFAPTRRQMKLDGVDLLELRAGLVCHYVGFFDSYDVVRQLGIMPARESAGERVAVGLHNLRQRIKQAATR